MNAIGQDALKFINRFLTKEEIKKSNLKARKELYMKYLIQTVETYRVDSEKEAVTLIEEAKADNNYILAKYTNEHKEVKAKGEVVDEYYKVTLSKLFNNIKEPDTNYTITYEVN